MGFERRLIRRDGSEDLCVVESDLCKICQGVQERLAWHAFHSEVDEPTIFRCKSNIQGRAGVSAISSVDTSRPRRRLQECWGNSTWCYGLLPTRQRQSTMYTNFCLLTFSFLSRSSPSSSLSNPPSITFGGCTLTFASASSFSNMAAHLTANS